MPGKHAPASPRSFYLSIARSVGGVVVAAGVVIGIVVVATGRGDDGSSPAAVRTPTPTKTTSALSPTPEPSPSVLPVGRTTVDVLNGTARTGLAGRVSERLKGHGYSIATVGNASATPRTTVFYRGARKAEADAFLAANPEFKRVRKAAASTGGKAMLTVVLGDDYTPDS